MKIAVIQFNPTVGDIAGNAARIRDHIHQCTSDGVDLAVFPELATVGYSHHDLLDNTYIVDAIEAANQWLQREMPIGIAALVGTVTRNPSPTGKKLFNAAAFLEAGKPSRFIHKRLLPTYDVYDEYRYFEPAGPQDPIVYKGISLGVHICEDMWNWPEFSTYHLYNCDPLGDLVAKGADLLINLSASPFSHGRHELRNQLIGKICKTFALPFVISNQVGANTELLFDGDSRVHAADGSILLSAPAFEEAVLVWDTDSQYTALPKRPEHRVRDIHDALVCGIREYVSKSGVFEGLLIGLSGGIDSAVTAALAVEALGAERVRGITMPSKYSSTGSVDDSIALAENFGFPCENITIKPAVEAFSSMLAPMFAGTDPGVAEENIQARARGLTLMAVSNKFNYLVLTTGNKSEMAMGYATLYGDMSGGLAVLADVFKTDVYALARYINERAGRPLIPVSSIEKAPSAELRPDQKDSDSLPHYDVLDAILTLYIEQRLDADQIVLHTGFDPSLVVRILKSVDRNEYKRKQAPPGLRVSSKAFGTGRRIPLVMHLDRSSVEEMTKKLSSQVSL